MKTHTILATILLALSNQCFATPDEEVAAYEASKKDPKEIIIPVLKQYANSIGCNVQVSPSNIHKYKVKKRNAFVVLYSLDPGCSGGSAMSRSVFALLDYAAFDKIVVNPDYSSPSQTSGSLPSSVSGIYIENNEIRYKALTHDFSKDALCCPSVQSTGTVKFIENKWVPIPD